MANTILTGLTGLSTPASGDFVYIVDISDTTDNAAGSSRKITYGNFVSGVLSELGITSSVAELNFVDGVTSAIQTQLDAKQAVVSGVDSTEIGYLNGVTSAIQTQLNAKAPAASPTFTGTVTLTGATIVNTGTLTFPTSTDTLVGRATTDTLTNKRITKRITTITSNANPTINTDNCDCVTITAQGEAIASMTTNLSGTPTNFQTLIIRIKDDGTARAITWGASFEARGIALPTTTVISKVLTVGFIYDTVTAKWGCVASAQEA